MSEKNIPKKNNAQEKKTFQFENTLQELETLVSSLENGELSLEDSLKTFERGIKLTRDCQQHLNTAEQKVTILVGDNESMSLIDFNDEHAEN